MRKVLFVSFVSIASLVGVPAVAADPPPKILDSKDTTFIHPKEGCEKNDTCDLVKTVFRVKQYLIPPEDAEDGEFLGTVLYASYETKSIETLRKYAFVQFIRGCVYRSWLDEHNEVVTHFSVARRYMDVPNDKFVTFCHRDWMIDSNEPDPIYSSEPSWSPDRHYFLQWNKKPDLWNSSVSDGTLYGHEKPTYPRGYVTDYPMQAYNLREIANNVSLEFRMCLYKTDEVPKEAVGSNINFAKPVICYDWSHKFVYDHARRKFVRGEDISPVCARPFTEEEESRDRFMRGLKDPEMEEVAE